MFRPAADFGDTGDNDNLLFLVQMQDANGHPCHKNDARWLVEEAIGHGLVQAFRQNFKLDIFDEQDRMDAWKNNRNTNAQEQTLQNTNAEEKDEDNKNAEAQEHTGKRKDADKSEKEQGQSTEQVPFLPALASPRTIVLAQDVNPGAIQEYRKRLKRLDKVKEEDQKTANDAGQQQQPAVASTPLLPATPVSTTLLQLTKGRSGSTSSAGPLVKINKK